MFMNGTTIFVWVFVMTCFRIGSTTSQVSSINGTWVQLGNDIYGQRSGDSAGYSIAMSADGTIVAVGSLTSTGASDYNCFACGQARVFQFGSTWTQLGSNINGDAPFDTVGRSLAMSADGMTVVVGADGHDGDIPYSDVGHVRVLSFNTTAHQWKQIGSDIEGRNPYDNSGSVVSMSADGTVIAIGAKYNNAPSSVAGSTYIRVYMLHLSTLQWEQLGPSIENISDSFFAMSDDGLTVAVGVSISDTFTVPVVGPIPDPTGKVNVYKYSFVSHQWEQVGASIDRSTNDREFGRRVAMSAGGTVVAITSQTPITCARSICIASLHVQVYEFQQSTSLWRQVGVDMMVDSDGFDNSYSMQMSANGRAVVIGSTVTPRDQIGHVRVFAYAGTSWKQVGSNITGDNRGELSGFTVAMSDDGGTVAIGAIFGGGIASPGRVRIYKFVPAPITNCNISWNLYNTITDQVVAPLEDGSIITNPPPCNRTNIEAVVLCAPINATIVALELYSVSNSGDLSLKHSRRENFEKYLLFGNNGNNIFNGRIPAGTYSIRAVVKGAVPSPFTRFTLGGNCI